MSITQNYKKGSLLHHISAATSFKCYALLFISEIRLLVISEIRLVESQNTSYSLVV